MAALLTCQAVVAEADGDTLTAARLFAARFPVGADGTSSVGQLLWPLG
jgi:hypothetical protein